MTNSHQNQETTTMGERFFKMERDAYTYKLVGVIGILLALAALGMSGYNLFQGRMSAESYILKDKAGTVLAELGTSKDGAPGLYIYDKNKNTRIWLGVQMDGTPRLVLGDNTGNPRASLVLDSEHQGQARLYLHDAKGIGRATLGLADNGVPGLLFSNDQGKPVFTVPPAAGATPQQRWVNFNAAGTRALVQGRIPEAQKLYLAALKEAQSFGPADLRQAATLNNMGVLFLRAQKPEEAEKVYQRSLEIRKKALGEEHPQVAQSLANIGVLRETQGLVEDAESLYKGAINIWEKAVGPDAPGLIAPLTQYAGLLKKQERNKEAKKLEERIEALKKKQEEAKKPEAAAGGE